MTPLVVSSGKPTFEEVQINIRSCLSEFLDALQNLPHPPVHYILMLDEIAVNQYPRYDDTTNKFTNICREHCHRISLEFNGFDDLEALVEALDEEEAHLAMEATVSAFGLLTNSKSLTPNNKRLHAARPIVISGSCKQGKAPEHTEIIQTIIDALTSCLKDIGLHLVSVASDGEAKRGKSLVQLTFKHPRPQDSRLNDLDAKHINKRLQNATLRKKGILVHGVLLTPPILRSHLRMAEFTAEHIQAIMNPNDKQDVKLAYDLLRDLWTFKTTPERNSPGNADARTALFTLGTMCFWLVFPYICVDLTLAEQLKYLSAASHLALALFRDGNAAKRFLPTALYLDIQFLVKNVYFCVSKAKVDDPSGEFYFTLLGTDRLETLFGLVHTLVANNVNLNILQLGNLLTGATEVATIFAKYPQWDKSPRRLSLPVEKELRYKENENQNSVITSISPFGAPRLLVNEPIATLIQVDEDGIILCIGEIRGLYINSKSTEDIALELLRENIVTIKYQAICLKPATNVDDPTEKHDWKATRQLDIIHTVPGRLTRVIDPGISTPVNGRPFWLFSSAALVTLASSLLSDLTSNDYRSIPVTKQFTEFPYREQNGSACFITENMEDLRLADRAKPNKCPACSPTVLLNPKLAQTVLAHMGSHCLFDTVNTPSLLEPCGLCLRPSPTCAIYLEKGRGHNGRLRVDRKRSTCSNLLSFSYTAAAQSTDNSPCSNVPLICSLCPSGDPAVWKYNMKEHIAIKHAPITPANYKSLWEIGCEERDAMRKIWKNRHREIKSRNTKKKAGTPSCDLRSP
ncbi:hypothetical protein PM082_014414 [Marasmius tenuissimus]|nr:hypothetical protein PM082_014414 [Marasmius tenuissimus]